jgi:PKD repeat protein
MALMHARTRLVAAMVGSALALSGCTVHKQATPSLTGPSELGTSITISVSPDVLTQDGASQSLVTITARNSNGQPFPNLQLRAEISVGGIVTDFGSLSARTLVTDASGRAFLIYTAPPAPALVVGNGTMVDIRVTPSGTNADNDNSRVASIRLVPPNTIGPPPSSLLPSFTAPAPNVGDTAFFSATVVDSKGVDATNQVASFQWSFGDGGAASGKTATHTFTRVGTFPVMLTITDSLGRVAFVTQSVTVGQGPLPNATFVTSPASPIVGQSINFNASGSTAAPGHVITNYAWDFGDGSFGSGSVLTHSYTTVGTYTVTLQVTDDAGRKSGLFQQAITVGTGNPQPDFTFNPSAPRSGQQVTFDASATQAAPGRTIVSYSWSFGDGGSGTGQTVIHTFTTGLTPTTYNVLLTVTDSAGKTSSITKPITVNP